MTITAISMTITAISMTITMATMTIVFTMITFVRSRIMIASSARVSALSGVDPSRFWTSTATRVVITTMSSNHCSAAIRGNNTTALPSAASIIFMWIRAHVTRCAVHVVIIPFAPGGLSCRLSCRLSW